MTLLNVKNLVAGYGDLQILEKVNIVVEEGEYVAIVGPNGAGKSTVMKSIFGLTKHIDGKIIYEGSDISGLPTEEIIKLGISYVPQNENVFPNLTVRENLELGGYIMKEGKEKQIQELFDQFPILKSKENDKTSTLSGGQQQMVAMARALVLNPKLLMLDEPSAGLAPDLVKENFDYVDQIRESGTAILMVEQNAKEALRRCDRGYVLVQGKDRFVDTGEALLNDEHVKKEFLGG
ncbi:ABC transporter ATP-binding protein [Candidatus Hikarchaeum yamanae]|uniref:ABC transporter ATP-binding protein n=1 Tax=Candidatus Hikarchaeum yamanae TaxID=2675326 RepID=UPI0039E8C6C2|tara:strand:- start:4110 stop:4814 length:705 start_codon:yes stop_codon:yes gene_type:complete